MEYDYHSETSYVVEALRMGDCKFEIGSEQFINLNIIIISTFIGWNNNARLLGNGRS